MKNTAVISELKKMGFDVNQLTKSSSVEKDPLLVLTHTENLSTGIGIKDTATVAFILTNKEGEPQRLAGMYINLKRTNDKPKKEVTLMEKSYIPSQLPWPTKEQIFKEMTEAARIASIKEKFSIEKAQVSKNNVCHAEGGTNSFPGKSILAPPKDEFRIMCNSK